MRKFENYREVKDAATGNWAYIFQTCAPELSEAIEKATHHVACPVHGGVDGFRLFKDYEDKGGGICNSCGSKTNGFAMLAWVRGYEIKDAVRDVAQCLGEDSLSSPVHTPRKAPPKVQKPVDTRWAYKQVYEAWTKSVAFKDSLAQAYLTQRGIPSAFHPEVLRFHPRMPYFLKGQKQPLGYFGCLLAPIRDSGNKLVSLHRIFLSERGGKAEVPDVKRMMPAFGELVGSAIRLYPAQQGHALGLTEGIETACAVYAGTGMPTWACVTAVLLENVQIPSHISHIVIWADLDSNERGAVAAKVLAERLRAQGKTVDICLPAQPLAPGQKGIDWLDVWNQFGAEGFPSKWRRTDVSESKKAA